jgi:glutamate synthase (NADPH/NADH) large chain
VHHRLTEKAALRLQHPGGNRDSACDPHHFAVLIGFGASAVYPFLAYEVLGDLIRTGEVLGDLYEVFKNYRKGITNLLKILSKMGISTITSYRGAQLFEAIGLSEVCNLSFRGVPSRIKGARFVDIEAEQKALATEAWSPRKPIQQGGLLKFVHGGEYHAYNPDVVNTLQAAVQQGDYSKFKEYTSLVDNRPVSMIRDLLKVKTLDTPLDISEIEPLESVLKRFDSAGISLGALSPEAHEALAEAMNRGARVPTPVKAAKTRRATAPSRARKSSRLPLAVWRDPGIPGQRRSAADQGRRAPSRARAVNCQAARSTV